MREYQHKHAIRTLLYSRFTIVILFLLCILLMRSVMELYQKRSDVAIKRDETSRELEDLEKKVDSAKKQLESIKTARGKEAYIRTTYPVVKEGEGVIVIYENNEAAVSEVRENMTLFEKGVILWNTLFKK